MSDLQYAAEPHDDFPWAAPTDRLIRIQSGPSTGKLIRVVITDSMTDTNYDGIEDTINALGTGSMVDEATGEPIITGGAPVIVNHSESEMLDILDDEGVTVAMFTANLTEIMIFQTLRRQQTLKTRGRVN